MLLKVRDRSNGFTLTEILVVIGIIGVLTAILLPTLGGARRMAHRVSCANNLRQVGMALTGYTTAFGDHYPIASIMPSTETDPEYGRIRDLLEPFGSAEIFECPDDHPVEPDYKFASYYEGEGSSYEWMEMLNGRNSSEQTAGPHDFSMLPIMYDYAPFHQRGKNTGITCLFTDGRVESF